MKCSVVNCKNSNEGKASTCSFFRFPSDESLRKKWVSFSGRKKFNPNTSYICMHHFKEEDFENNVQYDMGFAKKRLLKDGVVPTVNIASKKNDELHEQRSRRIERRENKKIVDMLLKNHTSDECVHSQVDVSFEHIDIGIENMDFKEEFIENIDEIEEHQLEEQSNQIISPDASGFQNLNLKVEALEKEILALREEKIMNDATLKNMNDKMEKMDKIHKCEMEQMKRYLAKAKFELACLEEKLQFIFTKGQIRKLKNGMKRQIWSEDDVTHSISLYSESPIVYKFLRRNQFPLPAVRTIQSWTKKLQMGCSNREIIENYRIEKERDAKF